MEDEVAEEPEGNDPRDEDVDDEADDESKDTDDEADDAMDEIESADDEEEDAEEEDTDGEDTEDEDVRPKADERELADAEDNDDDPSMINDDAEDEALDSVEPETALPLETPEPVEELLVAGVDGSPEGDNMFGEAVGERKGGDDDVDAVDSEEGPDALELVVEDAGSDVDDCGLSDPLLIDM